jgi:hypothetical protein
VATTSFSVPTKAEVSPIEPGILEVLALTLAGAAVFAGVILNFGGYHSAVMRFGDSQGYASVAKAILDWNFAGLQVKQFWGYPYAIAGLSALTRLPVEISLLLVSFASSLISIGLVHRLWGGWVAALFATLNFDWIQRSFLGGSEPLAVALMLGAFLAVRKDRFIVAAVLASLSTIVRPLGVFSLVAIIAVLLYRRDFKRAQWAAFIAAIVAVLYAAPLLKYFGDALATVHSYGGNTRPLFGIPFYAIVEGTLLYRAPLTNLILSFGWIAIVTAGLVMMGREEAFRRYARANAVEVIFVVPYLLLVYCYNYPVFARSNFARFAIPALPIIYFALSQWIPRNRAITWALGTISPALAACSAIGLRNVLVAIHGY